MLVHLLSVKVGDEEADIVSLTKEKKMENDIQLCNPQSVRTNYRSNLHWLSSEDEEMLSSHHHEPHKLLTQNLFNLISLQPTAHTRISFLPDYQEKPNPQKMTCLMAMDTLIELTEPSIKTFSFSFRLTVTGVRSNSLLLLSCIARSRYDNRGWRA